MIRRLPPLVVVLLAVVLMATGCRSGTSSPSPSGAGVSPSGQRHLSVVATTGYLGDAVHQIAPEAQVRVLVGPGGDPHTQALTTADAEAIEKADLVVWTSHDMEHQMMAQLEKLGERQIAAAESIPKSKLLPWTEDGKVEGHDPHVWNSPELWTYVVDAIGDKLAHVDPARAEEYRSRARQYNDKIRAMQQDAARQLAAIPAERRVLVTGHDAFNYLGKAFGIEIHATDFVSSEAQMSAKQIDDLAAMIVAKKVHVVFQDNLSNPDAIKHLKEAVAAKGGSVTISDEPLYADSLGESAPTDTYIGAFEHNMKAIVRALGATS